MNFLSKNLRLLRQSKGMKLDDFAFIGLTKGTLSNYELNKTEPKIESLIDLSKFYGYSIDDLINKDLEEEFNNGYSKIDPGDSSVKEPVHVIYESPPEYKIPIVDIEVISKSENIDKTRSEEYISVPLRLVNRSENSFCTKISTHSMYPTMQYGSYIIITRQEEVNYINLKNSIYVISTKDGLTHLNRVQNNISKGFIVLSSDNPDKTNYPAHTILKEDIQSIWSVDLYLTNNIPNVYQSMHDWVFDLQERVEKIEGQITAIKHLK